jgi:hypothetical protein
MVSEDFSVSLTNRPQENHNDKQTEQPILSRLKTGKVLIIWGKTESMYEKNKDIKGRRNSIRLGPWLGPRFVL